MILAKYTSCRCMQAKVTTCMFGQRNVRQHQGLSVYFCSGTDMEMGQLRVLRVGGYERVLCVVHFGYLYDVWLAIAHDITYIWNYSITQREDKLITGYRI